MIDTQKHFTVEVLKSDGTTEKKDLMIMPWGLFKAAKRLPQIGRVIAQPLSVLMAEGDDWKNAIPLAMAMLFDELEENDTEQFFKMVCDNVYYEKNTANLEEVCGTDLSVLCQIAAESIMLNYGSLYQGKGLASLMSNMTGVTKVHLAQQK